MNEEATRGGLKGDKFSVFNYMTASSRFEKAKTSSPQVSLFGQLNEGLAPVVREQAAVVVAGGDGEKIEFDSKVSGSTMAKSLFSDDGPVVTPEVPVANNNIYLQVRLTD